ncbi:hypothetical protein CKK33_12575 [Mucilaginibacter sp. MD40]|uniref:hypothetical protein n=1 Tax=Mucilaginibacter sp. MD40 TaxID=2029590 RepID=UPI000BACACCD|nr:hypothetical protein [Mucilaginibacter sp. MD40]PAW94276.1 hypothetical protein CKK33_12575 [Mucilaginibacter sp. MD40]
MLTKLRTLTFFALAALAITIYSACKKETKVSTVTTTINKDAQFASQLANNLYKALGNTVASKTTAGVPAANSVRDGKKINDLTCGQFIEQPFDNLFTKGDSVKDVMTGSFKYVINCENNTPNGYTYTGNYVNTGFNPYSTYDISVKEYYTLKGLAAQFSKMQVDGSQNSVYKITTKKDTETIVQNNAYNLKGLIIDSTTKPFDITAGTAEFVSNGTNVGKAFSFTGTITFLGNHKAQVTFGGKSFAIEIQ